jgi:hypothetical protein
MKFNLELPDNKENIKGFKWKSFDDVILDSEIIKEFSHFFNG